MYWGSDVCSSVLTCSTAQSRNMSFGLALGRGRTRAQALAGRRAVVEGIATAASVTALAHRLGVEMPICAAVNAIVHEGVPIDAAIRGLLDRPWRAAAPDPDWEIGRAPCREREWQFV